MAIKPITVSQLNSYIGRVLHTDPVLSNVTVKGEISNLKFHSSGHVYFSLKDDDSKINCFLPSFNLEHIRFNISEGMEIIAYGNISVYEKGGYYSLYIKDMDESGIGNLSEAFEKLKRKLEVEGLFEKKYKKAIPSFPRKIAIVTAPTGAAIKDILKIIKSKNNYVDILIYPVIVQGNHAADDIANAINNINAKYPQIDTIITGRGGGSLEDLWAFNEEKVARAIFASKIPIISAVGHEIDYTISDFVADARAETPTAAADMAVPDTSELMEDLINIRTLLNERINHITDSYQQSLANMNLNVFAKSIITTIDKNLSLTNRHMDMIKISFENKMDNYRSKLTSIKAHMDDLNPFNIMRLGYGVVTDIHGNMIGSISKIKISDQLNLKLLDGDALVDVVDIEEK